MVGCQTDVELAVLKTNITQTSCSIEIAALSKCGACSFSASEEDERIKSQNKKRVITAIRNKELEP